MEKHIEDYWNADGEREFSDSWTGFTRFILLNERSPDGCTWSGRRLTRKQTTSKPDNVWPDMWKHVSDASDRKAKQKWAIEKPKLDNARKLRGIFFIESEDEDFKNIIKNARRKLEIPMPAAMPCKTAINSGGETCCCIGKSKKKHAHEVSYCCERNKFMQSLLSGAQVNSNATSIKKPDAKAAVENGKYWRNIPAWQLTKVKKRGDR